MMTQPISTYRVSCGILLQLNSANSEFGRVDTTIDILTLIMRDRTKYNFVLHWSAEMLVVHN